MTKQITKEGRKWVVRWFINGHHFKTTEHKTHFEAQFIRLPPETKHAR